eukprot:1344503-Alexandrium_andersonii.AAC.1
MSASLVGSEMCIRDRTSSPASRTSAPSPAAPKCAPPLAGVTASGGTGRTCLLYTSDAADDM